LDLICAASAGSPWLLGYGGYGIVDLAAAESCAYLADPLLSQRLEQLIAVITKQLQQPGQILQLLMGGELDDAKAISNLTLFEAAGLPSDGQLLEQVGGRCCL
jgi:uncharacterized protein (DUF1810 family)